MKSTSRISVALLVLSSILLLVAVAAAQSTMSGMATATSATGSKMVHIWSTGVDQKITLDNLFTGRTMVTPALGVATATSLNGLTITTTTGTLTLTNLKTLAVTNTLTFTGTDATSFKFPATSATVLTSTLTTNDEGAANSVWGGTNQLIWEGATADGFEGIDTVAVLSADRVYTRPNVSGTYVLAQASVDFALTGDDETIIPGANTVIRMVSDDATAEDRTFTLSTAGAVNGALYILIGPETNACELLDAGIYKLSGDWTPGPEDTLTLLFDGDEFIEVSRSGN